MASVHKALQIKNVSINTSKVNCNKQLTHWMSVLYKNKYDWDVGTAGETPYLQSDHIWLFLDYEVSDTEEFKLDT